MNEVFYTDKKIKVNPLYKLYRDVKDRMMSTDNIYNQNITDPFHEYIEFQIKTNKLINIAVIGEVAHGKSTLACGLCNLITSKINEIIFKNIEQDKRIMGVSNICADTLEFSRKVHDSSHTQICFIIDEDNPMARVGANATTESARLQSFSRIQAQRFIHRVFCAPSTIADNESRVILQVMNYDIQDTFIRFMVWYRSAEPYGEDMKIIGFADISVANILNTKWYNKYKKKKFKKFTLINDAGIDDARAFEEAQIIMDLYKENKAIAKHQMLKISDLNLAVKQAVRENKSRASLILKDEFIKDIKSILDNVYFQHRELIKLEKYKSEIYHKIEEGKIQDKDYLLDAYAYAFLNMKIENNDKLVNKDMDIIWIERILNLDEQTATIVMKKIKEIINQSEFINNLLKKEILDKYSHYTKLIGIISYRYHLKKKLIKDIIYYKTTIDYYEEYKKISV
jgi:energy-coupling factor transporter ATP-binding protein EcfA2